MHEVRSLILEERSEVPGRAHFRAEAVERIATEDQPTIAHMNQTLRTGDRRLPVRIGEKAELILRNRVQRVHKLVQALAASVAWEAGRRALQAERGPVDRQRLVAANDKDAARVTGNGDPQRQNAALQRFRVDTSERAELADNLHEQHLQSARRRPESGGRRAALSTSDLLKSVAIEGTDTRTPRRMLVTQVALSGELHLQVDQPEFVSRRRIHERAQLREEGNLGQRPRAARSNVALVSTATAQQLGADPAGDHLPEGAGAKPATALLPALAALQALQSDRPHS